MKHKSSVRLIRHATLLLQINGIKLLVDPMLSARGELDPVQNCGNNIRIPMVDLPLNNNELKQMLDETDAVFVTHIHRDHWDVAAQKMIDKTKPIYCQPADEQKIKEQGFINVTAIQKQISFNGIEVVRTGGKHGTGEIGAKMGEVSGFVFKAGNHTLYVAGDTIWCDEVEKALTEHKPGTTIVNAGGAKFITGTEITMTPNDIVKAYNTLPDTKIIAVHMDTVNHCFIKRADLKEALAKSEPALKIEIPLDGEVIKL